MQLMMNRNLQVLRGLPSPTLHEKFRCSKQVSEDLNWFPVTLEPLLQFTVLLDEMMETFTIRSHNFWTWSMTRETIGETTRTEILFPECIGLIMLMV